MPDLPTITVTNAQMQRLMAVFGDGPAYKQWLKQQLKNVVISAELQKLESTHRVEMEAKRAEITADLDTTT